MRKSTSSQLLAAAVSHHRAGRLAEAEATYRELLRLSPNSVDGLHLLGLVQHQRGRHAAAIELIGRAIALSQGRPAAEQHNNMGVACRAAGRLDQAIRHLEQATALKPGYAEAWSNLGAALMDLGRLEDATRRCERAVALAPDSPAAHYALGAVFQAGSRLEEAKAAYERTIALKPDHAEAFNNLGSVLWKLGWVTEAAKACGRAVALKPRHAHAHYNLGLMLQDQGEAEAALVCYRQAQALRPDYAEAHWNEALACLAAGDFATGWRKYEWRSRLPGGAARSFPQPAWTSGEIAGRTLLIHAEQGFGDTIQFVRYAPLVARRGARVVLECQPSLKSLLERTQGVDRVVAHGDPLPAFDCHVALMSLPGIMGTRLADIPAEIPYLHPGGDRVRAWRERLARHSGLKVGLAWRGNRQNTHDHRRSIDVETIGALSTVPGARFFTIQPDVGPADLAALGGRVFDYGASLTDWEETAAMISALDLVIAVDTAAAHLAGALGKPVWIMLAFAPHWCWMRHREDSPWYPTARLFRQQRPGDWAPVVERAREALTVEISSAMFSP